MKKITIFILAFTISFAFSQSALAIGMMTNPIVLKDILRGQQATAILILSNSEDKEITYELIAEGEIKDWASFYEVEDKDLENPITKIQIPAESSLVYATVKFEVPEDTPNGEYSGGVIIITVPEEEKEPGEVSAAMRLRVSREVLITVTDQEIVKFDTMVIPLKYVVGKNQPLEIKIIHHNQGNVLIKPDIQLKISRSGETVSNVVFLYPEDENPVRPLERKIMPLIEWQTAGLGNGAYQAEVTVLLGDEIIKETKFNFSVGMQIFWGIFGILGKSGELINAHLLKIMLICIVIMSIITVYIKTNFFKNQLARIRKK